MKKRLFLLPFALLLTNGAALAEQENVKATDPTAPLSWMAPAKPNTSPKPRRYPVPRLQSIVCGTADSCNAILNNRLLEPGAWVAGYQIKTINKEQVVLTRQGKRWVLELFNSTIKQ